MKHLITADMESKKWKKVCCQPETVPKHASFNLWVQENPIAAGCLANAVLRPVSLEVKKIQEVQNA